MVSKIQNLRLNGRTIKLRDLSRASELTAFLIFQETC